MTTTPTAKPLTSPKTSDRDPAAPPRPVPPPNTSPPNFASSDWKSASSQSPCRTGFAAQKPQPLSNIPQWFLAQRKKSSSPPSGGVPRLPQTASLPRSSLSIPSTNSPHSAATKLPARSSSSTKFSTSKRPQPASPSPPMAMPSVISHPEPKPPQISAPSPL